MKNLKIKAFIIHLESAQERQAQVEKLCKILPIEAEIVQAVDARDLTVEEMAQFYQPHLYQPNYPFTLSYSEIACFLSHRKAWHRIVDSGDDFGLVLEDDVDMGTDFSTAFELVVDFATQRSLIRFPHKARESGQVITKRDDIGLIMPQVVGLGQVATFMSREVAQQLLAVTTKFDRPVDVILQMFWLSGIRPLTVIPSGISEISARIGGSTLHKKQNIFEKLRRELLRPLYRWQIKRLSQKYAEQS